MLRAYLRFEVALGLGGCFFFLGAMLLRLVIKSLRGGGDSAPASPRQDDLKAQPSSLEQHRMLSLQWTARASATITRPIAFIISRGRDHKNKPSNGAKGAIVFPTLPMPSRMSSPRPPPTSWLTGFIDPPAMTEGG